MTSRPRGQDLRVCASRHALRVSLTAGVMTTLLQLAGTFPCNLSTASLAPALVDRPLVQLVQHRRAARVCRHN